MRLYHWHSVALAIYLTITSVDFLVMPVWTQYYNHRLTADKMVELSTKFEGASQIAALQQLHVDRDWQPITLGQSGMFFVAFGAILGVGAWTRINEKKPHVLTS